MHPRTVVAWNGLPEADEALDWAVDRAQELAGAIVVIRIVDDALLEAVSADRAEAAVHRALAGLRDEAARLAGESPTLALGTEIVRGDPLESLVRMTDASTLLVLGSSAPVATHRTTPWSLAGRLVPLARGPLAIVPATPAGAGSGVVAGVDGSPVSLTALAFAADEADRLGERLTVVTAWHQPATSTVFGGVEEEGASWTESARLTVLDAAVASAGAAHPGVEIVASLDHGPASRALLEHSAGASLLVIGARGYGPVRGRLLGSVSSAVMQVMPCPVVVFGPRAQAGTATSWASRERAACSTRLGT